eukprot:3908893-Pleurochrysis_carterae.AAC.2
MGDSALEDVDDVSVNLALLVLRDAVRNPDDIADLLLLELDVGVVHAVVELLLEGERVELHLQLVELLLERLLAFLDARSRRRCRQALERLL